MAIRPWCSRAADLILSPRGLPQVGAPGNGGCAGWLQHRTRSLLRCKWGSSIGFHMLVAGFRT
jgi:hypothetical protein